ncbi:MAG: IS3 family transposase [Anaerolineae bacterium]|nr:IS3 family transposase [Anaerolineae bacterium]
MDCHAEACSNGQPNRDANRYDNAGFFRILNLECASDQFASHTLAHSIILEYIEVWDNHKCLHPPLGYLSPEEFAALLSSDTESVR